MELHRGGYGGGCCAGSPGSGGQAGGARRQEHHLVRDSQLLPQGLNAASLTFMVDRIDYVETYKCVFRMMPLHLSVSAHGASTDE